MIGLEYSLQYPELYISDYSLNLSSPVKLQQQQQQQQQPQQQQQYLLQTPVKKEMKQMNYIYSTDKISYNKTNV